MEVATSRAYHFDNSHRPRDYGVVIQYTFSGEGVLAVAGQKLRLGPGRAMLCLPPERSRYYFPAGGREPWRFCWVTIRGADKFLRQLIREAGPVVSLDAGGEAIMRLTSLAEAFALQGFRDQWEAAEEAYSMLMTLGREVQQGVAVDGFETAWRRIQDRARPLPTVKELAAGAGLSREHFTRRFQERMGASPGAEIRAESMRRAQSLLRTTTLSAEVVARRCGFAHLSTFGRAYQRWYGTTPAVDRRRG